MQQEDRPDLELGHAGDRTRLFLKLMAVNQKRIYGYILSLVPRISDADDIMQDTLVILWEKFDTFQEGSNFVAWANSIAYYRILHYQRNTSTGTSILDSHTIQLLAQDSAKEMADLDDRIEQLRKCIKRLPHLDRMLIHLRYDQEISVKRIAERIGRSKETVYKSLVRIYRLLFRCIHRQQFQGGEL